MGEREIASGRKDTNLGQNWDFLDHAIGGISRENFQSCFDLGGMAGSSKISQILLLCVFIKVATGSFCGEAAVPFSFEVGWIVE